MVTVGIISSRSGLRLHNPYFELFRFGLFFSSPDFILLCLSTKISVSSSLSRTGNSYTTVCIQLQTVLSSAYVETPSYFICCFPELTRNEIQFYDFTGTVIELEKDNYKVYEDDGKVVVKIVRSGDLSDQTTVGVVTLPGTAASPDDYGESSTTDNTLSFNPGGQTEIFLESILFSVAGLLHLKKLPWQ